MKNFAYYIKNEPPLCLFQNHPYHFFLKYASSKVRLVMSQLFLVFHRWSQSLAAFRRTKQNFLSFCGSVLRLRCWLTQGLQRSPAIFIRIWGFYTLSARGFQIEWSQPTLLRKEGAMYWPGSWEFYKIWDEIKF